MNTENEHEYFRAEMVDSTPKAVKYRLQKDWTEWWVPRSLHEYRNGILEVEQWFVLKEGIGGD